MTLFPLGSPRWPPEDPDVLEALRAAYSSGDWGRYEGPSVARLVAELAEFHQTPHVLPCCSGTVAVEIALRAVGVQAGDEVILAAYDFPGNFRAIEAVGARPVLVDIQPLTWCLAAEQISQAVGERTTAVIVSHLHGGLAAMPAICDLAQARGLKIVEDACQATGAMIASKPAGSWGDVGVLSFGGSKLLTSGRGGAVLIRDAMTYQRAKVFVERGNLAFPLSELQAAVLAPQLQKLEARNAARFQNVQRLWSELSSLAALRPLQEPLDDSRPAFYKLAWLFDDAVAGGASRADFLRESQSLGLPIDAGFRGFARRSGRRCRQVGTLAHSQQAAEQTVILHHPVLLEAGEIVDRVGQTIREVVARLYQQ